MKVTKEDLKKSQVKLTIELTADEFLPFIEKAGRHVAEHVEIAGFRKGQAPMEAVKQKVGEMAILQQAAEYAVQKSLPEAIEKEGLQTVGQPAIGLEKLAPENPLVFTATVPLMPSIKLGAISKVKAKKQDAKVTDEDVQKVIDNVRKMRASEVLADREAKMGDKVEISFKVFLDNVPIDGGTSEKYPLVLGEKSMIPGFEEQLIGLKKDQAKEFKLSLPADYGQKMLAGKECDFQVKMLAVYDVNLPAFDDAFAATLGDFKTVDDMKKAVRENLQKEKDQTVDLQFERDVLTSLVDASTFGDIPDVMLTQETQTMIAELEQNIARQGLDFAEYLKHMKKDRQTLALDLAPDAVKRIKTSLAIRELAKAQKIEVTKEETDKEVHDLAHNYEGNEAALRQINSPSYREYLGFVVRNRKAIHWLKEQVSK